MSATRVPGRASTSAATSWLPSSWISTRPARNAAPVVTWRRPSIRRPHGECGVGAAVHAFGGERGTGLLARRLQQVDPQIERRRFQQRAQFGRVDARQQPVRHLQPHRVGHRRMVERAALEPPQRRLLRRRQRRRREPAAGEARPPGVAAAVQQQRRRHQQPRCRPIAQPPAQPPTGAQHAPDPLRHRPPVAGADEPAGTEEVVGDRVRGARCLQDSSQQLDRGRDPRGGGQASVLPVVGRLAGDGDVVDVAFAQAGAGDAAESRAALQVGDPALPV